MPCIAEGSPTPKVSWRRDDNKPIVLGQWSSEFRNWFLNKIRTFSLNKISIFSPNFFFADTEVEGSPLNITRVRRDHFGDYVCTANNGIPPPATHRVRLEVTCKLSRFRSEIFHEKKSINPNEFFRAVSPTIKVPQQMIGSNNASSVLLRCIIESYPPALVYWIQGDAKLISENSWKYKLSVEEEGPFTQKMSLNISYVEPADYSMYKCAAKNEKGTTFGLLTLYGKRQIFSSFRGKIF